MKGQLSMDIIVAMIIFIGFVIYVLFQVFLSTPAYRSQLTSERMRSEAFQISEILINDPGDPINWESLSDGQINRIGLSNPQQNKTNYVSLSKANKLNTICSNNYNLVKSKLGITDRFSLVVNKTTGGTNVVICNPSQPSTSPSKAIIKRIFAFDDGSVGNLVLQVW